MWHTPMELKWDELSTIFAACYMQSIYMYVYFLCQILEHGIETFE